MKKTKKLFLELREKVREEILYKAEFLNKRSHIFEAYSPQMAVKWVKKHYPSDMVFLSPVSDKIIKRLLINPTK